MATPSTAQEVQALRGRIAQLEAELTAATTVTCMKSFVGSAAGQSNNTDGIDTKWPFITDAAPTARNAAELEYTKWKTANPGAIIVHEEREWHGLNPIVRPDNQTIIYPSLTITVRYRNP